MQATSNCNGWLPACTSNRRQWSEIYKSSHSPIKCCLVLSVQGSWNAMGQHLHQPWTRHGCNAEGERALLLSLPFPLTAVLIFLCARNVGIWKMATPTQCKVLVKKLGKISYSRALALQKAIASHHKGDQKSNQVSHPVRSIPLHSESCNLVDLYLIV